jgi:hypothetical protein
MKESYKKQVDEIGLFGEGVCHMCGKPGYHEVCEAHEKEIEDKYKENDLLYLKIYAVNGQYGISNNSSYQLALKTLKEFLDQPPVFDKEYVIEGDTWWYFPNGWIGVIGFIIEKNSSSIYLLGSGWGGIRDEKYKSVPAHWVAIEAYINGQIEPVNST